MYGLVCHVLRFMGEDVACGVEATARRCVALVVRKRRNANAHFSKRTSRGVGESRQVSSAEVGIVGESRRVRWLS